MAPKPGDPLLKVTLNLYADDVAKMERLYGRGWSVTVRELVREHVTKHTQETFEWLMK